MLAIQVKHSWSKILICRTTPGQFIPLLRKIVDRYEEAPIALIGNELDWISTHLYNQQYSLHAVLIPNAFVPNIFDRMLGHKSLYIYEYRDNILPGKKEAWVGQLNLKQYVDK